VEFIWSEDVFGAEGLVPSKLVGVGVWVSAMVAILKVRWGQTELYFGADVGSPKCKTAICVCLREYWLRVKTQDYKKIVLFQWLANFFKVAFKSVLG